MNYKGLPYKTEWLTHPEIAPKLKDLSVSSPFHPILSTTNPSNHRDIPPSTSGQGSPYTLPTIRLPDGKYVMDSLAIADKLESLHPSPSLHLDNNLHKALGPIMGKVSLPLIPVFMPRIGRDIVPESAMAYFQETRGKRFGMPLDELEAQKGGPQAWDAAKPGIEDLKAFLKEHKRDEGPFVLGSEVCYADFVIAAMMESLLCIGPDLYEGFAGESEELRALHQACGKWMEKDT